MNNKKGGNKISRPLTNNEFLKIIEYIKSKDVKLMLIIEATTGLRIQDIAILKWSNLRNGKLEISEMKTKKTQNREYPLWLRNMLEDFKEENCKKINDYLFLENDKNFKNQINALVRKCQRQIQTSCKLSDIESTHISTHSFRKYFATENYKATKDIVLIQEMLNHTSLATTRKYIRINQEEVNEVCRNFDPFSRKY
ncbi:tyrosine-type recombinase/integrase [Cetobacterium sp. 2A]|uniref:tyrosine-type recombinase/integrase n=1 Tax=Cetobacterium sp. 2A TaxID=2754723 RepID=UPI00163B83B9|nr:tyrosine-type recombinase/integrase [Cetobacterium sp. 2A]MBC2857093.1 tyrosine-type recombinase/integrase [Cetobacterium sp. 2A]